MNTLKKLKLKLLYSAKTHYLLNNLTLSIKDKEVERDYTKARINNSYEHAYHALAFSVIYFAFRLFQVLYFGTKITRAFYAFHLVFYSVIWFIMKKTNSRFSPLFIYVAILNQCLWTVLSSHKLLPDIIARDDFKDDEVKILTAVIALTSINYNTFLSTAILLPLITLPCFYFSESALQKMKFDGYTKEPLKDDPTAI
jgi:hypothetical protein